jgi:hypothetical protein
MKLVDIDKKRNSEKLIVKEMIQIYCKKKHKTVGLCKSCKELLDYSFERIDKCPLMETKTFCSNCNIHCYDKKMAEKIRKVMKYSGPRIFFYHPLITIKHIYLSKKKK